MCVCLCACICTVYNSVLFTQPLAHSLTILFFNLYIYLIWWIKLPIIGTLSSHEPASRVAAVCHPVSSFLQSQLRCWVELKLLVNSLPILIPIPVQLYWPYRLWFIVFQLVEWYHQFFSIFLNFISSFILFPIPIIDAIKSNAGGKILVHCRAGISRSATICIAYLIKTKRIRMEEAYDYVKSKRCLISPNFNFMAQLLAFEDQVFSNKSTNSNGRTEPTPVST